MAVEIRVRAIPNSRAASVEKLDDGTLKVKVDAIPEKGKANKRLIEIVADHLNIPKSKLHIVSGARSRNKIIHVDQ